MFQDVLSLILHYDTIILHRHSKPDGDALGSQIGLKNLILENFPQKQVYIVGDDAGGYGFMQGSEMDSVPDCAYVGALVIILDCGSRHLISDNRYSLAEKTIRIDHHLQKEAIADVEIIDPSFESCCGMIAAFAQETGLRVNSLAAKSLYTGMVTDSGRFRYDNTTARTFRLAAFLMEQHIDTVSIFRDLYAESYESKKRKAEFTLKINFTPNHVAYIYTTLEEFRQLNADSFSISRGMVNLMADIQGVDIWANFTETDNGVLCELRSSSQNINPIAVKYGGGGHAKASGATLPNRAAAMAMLTDLDQLSGAARA